MFFSVLFCTVRLSIFERFVFASFEPLRFCKKVRFVFPDLNRKIPHWLAFPYTYCNRKKSTAPFVVLGRCIRCGACAKKCPMGAIEMRDNRPIWIKEQCLQCLGCLHRCPVFAIQYGKKTIKHGQFVHPGVKM